MRGVTFKSLDYKISFAADTSGARQAADALGDVNARARDSGGAFSILTQRGGAVNQAFIGTRMAAQGNVGALFNVARAMRAVWAAGGPITIILMVIAALLALASAAWQKYKTRQDEAAKGAKEATEKLIAAQQRLNDVIAATKAPNYDAQIKGMQAIATAYSEAEAAAKNYKDAQDQVAAARVATEVAGIQETAQREIGAAAGDEDKQAIIALNAQRAIAAVTYQEKYAAIEKNAAAEQAHLARLKQTLNDLALQDIAEMFSTPLKRAEEEVARIKTESRKTYEATGKGPSVETYAAMEKATAARDKLKAESEKVAADRATQVRKTQADIAAAEQVIAVTPEKKAQLAAEFSAQEAAVNTQEKLRVADQDKLRAEQDILKTKEEIRKQAEAETEAVKKSGEERADQLDDEIVMNQIEQERADAKVAQLTERVSSPAARHAQDKADREAKRAEDKLEKQIRQAEESKARGARGKNLDDLLALKAARVEAATKKGEFNQLEQDRTVAAKESRDMLKTIASKLEAAITMS